MKVVYKRDLGKKRKNNEDAIYIEESEGIYLLADGMGGHQAGEVASDLAVNEAYSFLKNMINEIKNEKDITKLLIEAFFKAHDAIKEKAKNDLNLMGMGTTLVEMVIKNGKAFICHVGDSRAYHLRDEIRRVTKDHTVGDYLVEHNIMSREQIPAQKWHTLTQAVGVSENLVPELNQVELREGDNLLLCSDGLTDMLTDDEIFEIVKKHNEDVEKAIDALIEEANKKGGRDNISVVLVRYE